jgi:cellulose synthase/poly-beta-1,6-N-acetylglucosamine synthase-like glycosyltransferase
MYLLYGIYFVCITFTLSYAVMQLGLLIVYVAKKYLHFGYRKSNLVGQLTSKIQNLKSDTPSVFLANSVILSQSDLDIDDSKQLLPRVTIQLPLYNEQYVAERLIDNIAKINYPYDRLQIQVLDDSTDETTSILAAKIEQYQRKGFPIEHIRRPNRTGYKAGALKDGMTTATGEFIAIFDADFLPKSDFLKRTIPFFEDPSVGTVQTRWGHLNENETLLTRLQALQVNVHFTIEQKGREYANFLRQFNGTAGVWRRKTIESVGNWQTDTLIEDVDLSMRAQLTGWRILIREDIVTPAELPATMNALKVQQFRWMKGGAENAMKQMKIVLGAKQLSFLSKCHSVVYLMASSMFIATVLMSLVSIPLMFYIKNGVWNSFWQNLSISASAVTIVLTLQILVANLQSDVRKNGFFKALLTALALIPLFFTIMSGMAFHNAMGVIEAYLGKKTSFMRTPKAGASNEKTSKYSFNQIPKISLVELALGLVFGASASWGFAHHVVQFQAFHVVMCLGYLSVSGYSILPIIRIILRQYQQKVFAKSIEKVPQQPVYNFTSLTTENS